MRKFRFAVINIVLLVIEVTTADDAAADGNDADSMTRVGDMLLSSDQLGYLYATDEETRPANPFVEWPNGTLFYKFDESLDAKARTTVANAMSYIASVSCVRFVETREQQHQQQHYVLIRRGNSCSSEVGMRSGRRPQQMIIDGNLCSMGSVIHELLHGLGFLHMHTASERDEFIKINWSNVRDDAKLNFMPFTTHVNMFDTQYDYDSITHYGRSAFAKNRRLPTIIARNPAPNMGQRKEMSVGDITRLNRMYRCPNFETKPSRAESTEDESVQSNPTDDDEDDMILSERQLEAMYSLSSTQRNGLTEVFRQWPMGVVPFEIDPGIPAEYALNILDAMEHISNRSCIRFVPKVYQINFIYIQPGLGCSSEVGMNGRGRQSLILNVKTCPTGRIIHELLHSLGFFHMHTTSGRDNFIRVNWANVKEEAKRNFEEIKMHVSLFSTPYDYGSIMHYSPWAFSKSGKKLGAETLLPQARPDVLSLMGQRAGMSEGDVKRLNAMYKCKRSAPAIASNTTIAHEASRNSSSSSSSSGTEAGGEISENTESDKQKKPKTLFGILIFKIASQN